MPIDPLFRLVNSTALICWIALIALPRKQIVDRAIALIVIGGLCTLYSVLVLRYFFGVEGGGFFSLASVQRMFSSPPVALAGWIHYLAFDLLVGQWIAGRCDALRISRWIQAPILVTTFMFGPIGALLAAGMLTAQRMRMKGAPP